MKALLFFISVIGRFAFAQMMKIAEDDLLELGEQQVRTSLCQILIDWDFYDLKEFESLNRIAKTGQPAHITEGTTTFYYKMCQPNWKLSKEWFDLTTQDPKPAYPDSCNKMYKNEAFLVKDGECAYSFGNPFVEGIRGTQDGETNVGFKMKYVSKARCKEDSGVNFEIQIDAKCNKEKDGGILTFDTTEKCGIKYKFEGKEACKKYTIEIEKYMKIIAPYIGAILVVLGLIMTFAGAKFLVQLFSVLVCLFVTSGTFLIIYNFFLPHESINIGILVVIFICTGFLGYMVAHFTKKFAEEWATTLLAAWGGIVVIMQLMKIGQITNGTMLITGAIAGAFIGSYLGKQLNDIVKSFGTAFIGAFFVIKGVSFYIGGFPTEAKAIQEADLTDKEGALFWAYFGAFVALTIFGTFTQMYVTKANNEEKDDEYQNGDGKSSCFGC